MAMLIITWMILQIMSSTSLERLIKEKIEREYAKPEVI